MQLGALNEANKAEEMNLPGWNFHCLTGRNPKGQDFEGHYTVSVNGHWRLTFAFENGDAILVDYQDYH